MWVDREGHLDLVLMETLICLDLGDHQDLDMSMVTRMWLDLEGHLDWNTLVKKRTWWDFTDLHNSAVSTNRISTVMQSLRFTVMECREDLVPVDQSD